MFGLLVSWGEEWRRLRSISADFVEEEKRREAVEVWDSRTDSQYQHVHSE